MQDGRSLPSPTSSRSSVVLNNRQAGDGDTHRGDEGAVRINNEKVCDEPFQQRGPIRVLRHGSPQVTYAIASIPHSSAPVPCLHAAQVQAGRGTIQKRARGVAPAAAPRRFLETTPPQSERASLPTSSLWPAECPAGRPAPGARTRGGSAPHSHGACTAASWSTAALCIIEDGLRHDLGHWLAPFTIDPPQNRQTGR